MRLSVRQIQFSQPCQGGSFYHSIVAKGGGMITCGGHLGVYVGTDIRATPRAWAFIDIREATPELIAETVEAVKEGRTAWPERDDGSKPTDMKVRRV